MRSMGFVPMVVVALCLAGVTANADTVDPSAGSSAVAAVAQPAGQVDTAVDADAAKASADDPAAGAAVPPEGQVGAVGTSQREKEKVHVAVAYFAFIPTDGETRSNFGKVWNGFGLGFFAPEHPEKKTLSWSVSVLSKNGASDVLLIPLTVGVLRGFSQDPDRLPYVTVRVGPYYGKVDDNLQGPDAARIGGSANVALGLIINRQFLLEARYDWFTRLEGNNFNGLTLTAAVKVFQYSR